MPGPDALPVLRALVDAHAQPDPRTGKREPIWYFRYDQGDSMQHHALPSPQPEVDDALLEELHAAGLLNIEWERQEWKLTPTVEARNLLEQHDRVANAELVASVDGLKNAVATQLDSPNRLQWPAVRPVLAALRRYWEDGGFSEHGIQLGPIHEALPDEQGGLFAATVRALVEGGYLRSTSARATTRLEAAGRMPAEVVVTDHAFRVLDGWPGASPEELFENLLAVLVTEAQEETDPARKRKLEKLTETVREVGVSITSEILKRVILGG
jgi:hypothetical protein